MTTVNVSGGGRPSVVVSGNQVNASVSGGQGPAATIQVGTVTTGSPPAVVNSGTPTAAVLDFVLPAGGGGGGAVDSVNGQTGVVVLTSTGVSAASAVHTHAIADVTGLQSALDGKQASGSYAAASHTHATSDITGFAAAAASASPVQSVAGRTGTITLAVADVANAVSGSDSRLSDARTPLAHTHAASDVTSGTFDIARIPTVSYTALSNVPTAFAPSAHTHDASAIASGTINAARLPANVATLNGLSGTLTIAAGDNVTVSTSGSSITIAAGGGGGGGTPSTHAPSHQVGGSDELLPVVTAVSLTASVNNYTLPTASVLRLSHGGTSTVEITGLSTAADGAARLFLNVSTAASATYTLKHQDTNSTAVSQIVVPWAGDYILSPNGGAALLMYDTTDSRWRVV